MRLSQAWDLFASAPAFSQNNHMNDLFHDNFHVIPAMRPEDLDEVYKLRYQVYCIERRFENPHEYPNQQEIDIFDKRSVYTLLQHKKSGEFIGTARLVLPDRKEMNNHFYNHFPAQIATQQELARDNDIFPIDKTAEISRICFSQEKTRKLNINAAEQHLILPGLLRGIYMLRDLNDVDHFMALLEKRLIHRSAQIGFTPTHTGDAVSHKGQRYLVHYDSQMNIDNIRNVNKQLWGIITADGKYCKDHKTMTIDELYHQWGNTKQNTLLD